MITLPIEDINKRTGIKKPAQPEEYKSSKHLN
jgi:hypothetical protein